NNVGGTLSNAGTWTGTMSNAGTFNHLSGGTLSGLLTNTGTANSAGTLNGGLTNTGTFSGTGGAVNGVINNSGAGTITIAGTVTANGALTNSGTARLIISSGGFSGLPTVTNSSTNAQGIAINTAATLSASSLSNALGSTLLNLGTLTTTAGTSN